MGFSRGFLWLGLAMLGVCAVSCANENQTDEEQVVVIRVSSEPDNLNPTRSRSSVATPIESLIALPLAEYDPYTLSLDPLLIKSLGNIEDITEGPYAGGQRFHYEMREEAVWDDGSPITGLDYAFTVKAVLNPKVDAAEYRSYLSFIKDVEVDEQDPRKFAVTVDEPYMLAEAITCNFNILPAYVYDPNGYMSGISVSDLSNEERLSELEESEPALAEFGEFFGSVGFNRDTVVGSGPYHLAEWVTGQQIVLERKDDWWGDKVEDAPGLLRAYPDRIVYRIIPDEAAAIAALKDGSVDFIAGVSATAFTQMRDNGTWQDNYAFVDHPLLQYRYLEVNNRNEILADKHVRKALAYSIDYNAILQNVELGMGRRTVGPFSPSKDYYNTNLAQIDQNIDTARYFLTAGGWSDSDNDGTVDKVINGVATGARNRHPDHPESGRSAGGAHRAGWSGQGGNPGQCDNQRRQCLAPGQSAQRI